MSLLGRVGIVAVAHDVAVGLDAVQHVLHDEALALARVAQDHRTVLGCDGGGTVRAAVVEDVDRRLG